MKVGYIRVSTEEQNSKRQEMIMEQLGVEKVFIDQTSGKDAQRKQLQEMMRFVRNGDIVIVESISRFARNTKDLLQLVEQLAEKEVAFISQKEKIDTNTPTGKFMLTIFGAVAELERESILQRQREGIEAAKKAGKYKGRKRIPVDNAKFKMLYGKWKSGELTAVQMQQQLQLTPCTFYRRVKKFEQEGHI